MWIYARRRKIFGCKLIDKIEIEIEIVSEVNEAIVGRNKGWNGKEMLFT